MPFGAGTVWEVRTGGSDTNNGGGMRGGAVISTPASAPTVNGSTTGGTVAANTYYAVVTFTDAQGETRPSSQSTVTTTGATSSITVTAPTRPSNAMVWNLYLGTVSGGPYFLHTSAQAFGSNRSVTATPATTGNGPPGVDYSQQDASQVTYTDLVIDSVTNTLISSAANPFTQSHVGNFLSITAGTGFTVQRLEILNVSSAGLATVDKSAGTLSSVGGTGRLGGALASLGRAGGLAVAGNIIFRKRNASAEVMSASNNVAGGRITASFLTFCIISYDTNRTTNNQDANRQVIQPGANSVTCFTLEFTAAAMVCNFSFTNPSAFTGCNAIAAGSSQTHIRRVAFSGTWTTALNITGNGTVGTECEFSAITGTSCQASGAGAGLISSTFDNCSGTCFSAIATNGYGLLIGCIFSRCSGQAITSSSGGVLIYGCSVQISSGGSSAITLPPGTLGSIVYNTSIWGNASNSSALINLNAAPSSRYYSTRLVNCAVGNGGSPGPTDAAFQADAINGLQTLTSDPYTNAASGNFAPNSTAGGGTVLRGNATPATFPGLSSTTNSQAIGAVQPAASSANAPAPPIQSNMWSWIG